MIIMRKVRLNSGLSYDVRRKVLQDIHLISANLEFVQRAVAVNDTSVASIKEALAKASATMVALENYVGSQSVNSARLPVGSRAESDDATFLEEADSVLGLEDGESIDISKAQLLYNEDTLELMLTDEEEIPDGFDVVGTVVETQDTENDAEEAADAPETDDSEKPEKPESAEDTSTANDTSDESADSAESAAPAEESEGGIF